MLVLHKTKLEDDPETEIGFMQLFDSMLPQGHMELSKSPNRGVFPGLKNKGQELRALAENKT